MFSGRMGSRWGFAPSVLFALLLVGVVAPTIASAADYYVDAGATSASDSSSGALTSPLLTIAGAAAKNPAAGSNVYVNPGNGAGSYVYRGMGATAQTTSGTAASPILYRGDGLNSAGGAISWTTNAGAVAPSVPRTIVDGAATDAKGLNCTGAYVEFLHFEVRNIKNASGVSINFGVFINAANCTLDDLYIHNFGGAKVDVIRIIGAGPTTIKNSTIGDVSAAIPELCYIALDSNTSAGSVFSNDTFVNLDASGFGTAVYVYSSNNNLFQNCWFYKNAQEWSVFSESNTTGTVMTGCTVVDTATGTTVVGCVRLKAAASACVLRNNIFYTTNVTHYCLYVDSTFSSSNYNCFWATVTPTTVIYIGYNTKGYTLSSNATTGFPGYQTDSGAEGQSFATDPQMVSTTDAHLQSTFGRYSGGSWVRDANDSPCIDAATPAPKLTSGLTAGTAYTTVSVTSTRGFPATGTIYLRDVAATKTQGSFAYISKTATSFSGASQVVSASTTYATTDQAFSDDTTATPTPTSIADWSSETTDNGARRDIGFYGNNAQGSLSGVQGAGVTWVGGDLKDGSGSPNPPAWSGSTGSANTTQWSNPSNWSTAWVPTSSDNVYIPWRSNACTEDAASASCGSLTISNASVGATPNSGGTLNINSATARVLTVSGAVNINAVGGGTATTPNLTVSGGGHTINVTGNWTSNGTYSDTSGTVVFNGTANQTLAANGAGTDQFFNITYSSITSGTQLQTTSSFNVGGNFINSSSGATLPIVSATAGTITFNGSATQTIGGSVGTTFYNLQLSNNQTRQFGNNTAAQSFAVSNSFTWNDGNLTVGQTANPGAVADKLFLTTTATLTVPNLRTLTTQGGGILDVGANTATLAGVTIESAKTLKLGTTATSVANLATDGNFTNNGTFTADNGLVTLNGTAAQTVGGTQGTSFYQLTLNNTSGASPAVQIGDGTTGSLTFVVTNTFTWTAGSVQVGQGAKTDTFNLTLAAATVAVPTSTSLATAGGSASVVNVGGIAGTSGVYVNTGTLQLGAGSLIRLASASTLSVASGATLSTSGTSAGSMANVSAASGNYGVTIGGSANINYLSFDGLNAGGVVVQAGATLTGWTGINFASSAGGSGSVYMDLSACTSATGLPKTMSGCWFSAGPQFNVKGETASTASVLYFVNWGGPIGGESNETSDANDLVRWGGGVVRKSDGALFGSINDAINDAGTTSASVLEVRDNVIRNETINFPALGKYPTIDGAVLSPPSGSVAVIGSGDVTKEILQNCVLIRPAGSTAALVQNVARMFHCDILGAGGSTNALAVYNLASAPNTYRAWACIVGDPASWGAVGSPISVTGGTLTVSYSDVEGPGVYAGTGNINSDPLLVKYVPTTGLYDVHLKSTSPCNDVAFAANDTVHGGVATDPNITTDLDRGSDISDPSTKNPNRPIAPLAGTTGHDYDVGAIEIGEGTVGSPTTVPQSLPLWVRQTGPASGGTNSVSTDVVPVFDFAGFVLFLGDNIDTSGGGAGKQIVRAIDMNTSADKSTFDLGNVLASVRKVYRLTVTRDPSGGTDSVYCVVNTTADAVLEPNAIVALSYDGTTITQKAGWTNPAMGATGSGRLGSIVIDKSGNLFFVKGRRLYYLQGANGSAGAGTNWAADGHNIWNSNNNPGASDDIYDAEGGPVSDRFNDIVQAPLAGHVTDQIWRITISSGARANRAQVLAQAFELNDTGFNQIGGRVYLTPSQGDYVAALNLANLTGIAAWVSGPLTGDSPDLGTNVTTRAATLNRLDADVRVGAGNKVFRLQKDTGAIAADSGTSGSHDWGTSNPLRGNLTSTPFIVGNKALSYVDGRTGSKMFFGTNQGCCYVLSYIRNTTGNTSVDGDAQPSDSGGVTSITDGRPYPGFPYRVLGGSLSGYSQVRITLVVQGYSTTYSRNLLVFVCDNGWIYAFLEPY